MCSANQLPLSQCTMNSSAYGKQICHFTTTPSFPHSGRLPYISLNTSTLATWNLHPAAAASPIQPPPAPEPMQTDCYHLSPAAHSRRITQGLCLYCGAKDHLMRTCPVHPPVLYCPMNVMSTVQINPGVSHVPLIDAVLMYLNQSFPVKVLVDSGASANFISSLCLSWTKIPCQQNPTSYQISTIQGKPLGKGLVRHCTPELSLCIGCFHNERLSVLVLEDATVDIVLGCPWLAQHHPDLLWTTAKVLQWSKKCHEQCLMDLPALTPTYSTLSICSTSIESPASQDHFQIPQEYQAFQDVFSKVAATHLPPHRPWDCVIDLLPGAKLPKGH
ncbi:hypothetical protein M9458_003509, partial [Cirrhinus mrigala]